MPWSDQTGGGGWKGGGGGPWGPRPGPGQQPDLEEILRRSQDRLRQAIPGGQMGGPLAILLTVVIVALVGFFGSPFPATRTRSASYPASASMGGRFLPASISACPIPSNKLDCRRSRASIPSRSASP